MCRAGCSVPQPGKDGGAEERGDERSGRGRRAGGRRSGRERLQAAGRGADRVAHAQAAAPGAQCWRGWRGRGRCTFRWSRLGRRCGRGSCCGILGHASSLLPLLAAAAGAGQFLLDLLHASQRERKRDLRGAALAHPPACRCVSTGQRGRRETTSRTRRRKKGRISTTRGKDDQAPRRQTRDDGPH